jgi:Uma2 family endonuclease
LPFSAFGEWTQLDETEEAAVEPDECYTFSAPWRRDDHADLAVEVVWTRGAIKKLEIYRRLGVPEVWIWEDDAIRIFRLAEDGYQQAERSRFVPDIDLVLLCSFIDVEPMSDAMEQYRVALRGQGA